jgi:integrase
VPPGRKPRAAGASLEQPPRIFDRRGWKAADFRAWGQGRPTLRDPGAPGWPNAGRRTSDPEVALRWALRYIDRFREDERRDHLKLGPRPKRLGEAAEAYIDKRRDAAPTNTWQNDRAALNHLREFAATDRETGRQGDQLLTDRLGVEFIQRFFDRMVAGQYAAVTLTGYQRGISGFLRDLGHGDHNAARQARIPSPVHEEVSIWTDDQRAALRKAADALDQERDDFRGFRLLLELGLAGGLRRNELFAVRWEQFNPHTCTVRLTHQLHKSERRLVPLKSRKPRTVLLLPDWWAHHQEGRSGLLFPGPDGGLSAPDQIAKLRKDLLERAGLYRIGVGFHVDRHTYAHDFIVLGGRFEELQKSLGHTSIRTTETLYGHFHEDVAASLARARIYRDGPLRALG